MTGIVTLDVVIGLVFVFLLYSLLCTILQEILATTLAFRAKILEKGLYRLLEDEDQRNRFIGRLKSWSHFLFGTKFIKKSDFLDAFKSHPLMRYLGEDKLYSKPAYLSAENFSKILLDILKGENFEMGNETAEYISKSLKDGEIDLNGKKIKIPTDTLRYLRSIWFDAKGEVGKFKYSVENWFDTVMERSTGWYKQYTQVILLVIGFAVAVVFNVDTILLVKKLGTDPELRKELLGQAETYLTKHPNLKSDLENLKLRRQMLSKVGMEDSDSIQISVIGQNNDSLQLFLFMDSVVNLANKMVKEDVAKLNTTLGFGWECRKSCDCNGNCSLRPKGTTAWPLRFLGWLLTALAISLGAPFWFDTLSKLMNLRGNMQNRSNTKTSN